MADGYPADWDRRRKRVYRRDGYRCQRCGAAGGPRGNSELHAHHQIPKSQGGSHHPSNLVTLCQSCHSNVHGHPVGGGSSSGSSSSHSSSSSSDTEWGPAGTSFIIGFMTYMIGASFSSLAVYSMVVNYFWLVVGGIVWFGSWISMKPYTVRSLVSGISLHVVIAVALTAGYYFFVLWLIPSYLSLIWVLLLLFFASIVLLSGIVLYVEIKKRVIDSIRGSESGSES